MSPPVEPVSIEAPNAHPWRRLMGIVYECIILFGLLWLANYVFSSLTNFKDDSSFLRAMTQALSVIVMGAYFGLQWAAGRRTLPMKTLDLQLLDSHGRYLTLGRALLRYLAALAMLITAMAAIQLHPVGWLVLIAPAGWSLIDKNRRALYDVIAGTRLVTLSAKAGSDPKSGD